MDRAKAAVSDFLHKADHHNTTVHEKVNAAVVHETVQQSRHVQEQKVIDREIHQDHYHTSVQPILDREVLPEKHAHQALPVEHREKHLGGPDVTGRIQADAAKFTNKRIDGGVQETHSTAAPVIGEHKHHHIHETIQPVIQKETIQPVVVHTTIPVHETIHLGTEHHATSALPAVTMADYKKQGGVLSGREERYDGFEGEPRNINALGTAPVVGNPATGLTGTSGLTGTHGTHGTHHNTTSTTTKPSLIDRLNPLKDTDHDGKKGIME